MNSQIESLWYEYQDWKRTNVNEDVLSELRKTIAKLIYKEYAAIDNKFVFGALYKHMYPDIFPVSSDTIVEIMSLANIVTAYHYGSDNNFDVKPTRKDIEHMCKRLYELIVNDAPPDSFDAFMDIAQHYGVEK